jgi:Cu-processing system permease protein
VKAITSLLNIVLIVLPLFSVVFASSYYYNAYEFTELILAQPIKRSTLFFSQFVGVGAALSLSFIFGCGIPVLIFFRDSSALILLCCGLALTWVFTAIAFLAVVYARDKTKGIGIALLLWFYFVFIYDALVLLFLFNFSNYPLEKMLMMLTFLNPVDLTRIIMLMQLDMAAIMGYTGALFTQFLGSSTGLVWCFFALLLWIAVPFILAQRKFTRKDI